MKTVQCPENKDDLRNMLIHDDIVLRLSFSNLDYSLSDGAFSAYLSIQDVMNMITDVLSESGIVITWNMG